MINAPGFVFFFSFGRPQLSLSSLLNHLLLFLFHSQKVLSSIICGCSLSIHGGKGAGREGNLGLICDQTSRHLLVRKGLQSSWKEESLESYCTIEKMKVWKGYAYSSVVPLAIWFCREIFLRFYKGGLENLHQMACFLVLYRFDWISLHSHSCSPLLSCSEYMAIWETYLPNHRDSEIRILSHFSLLLGFALPKRLSTAVGITSVLPSFYVLLPLLASTGFIMSQDVTLVNFTLLVVPNS